MSSLGRLNEREEKKTFERIKRLSTKKKFVLRDLAYTLSVVATVVVVILMAVVVIAVAVIIVVVIVVVLVKH